MAIAPNPNVARVELRYDWEGQKVENTLFFRSPGVADAALCANLASEVLAWWQTEYQPLLSQAVALREVYAKQMVPVGAYEGTDTTGLPQVGGISSPAVPNNVSLTISFRTGVSGRSTRGRNYIIGIPNGSVDHNFVDASYLSQVAGAYNQLLPVAGYVTVADWVVYSQYFNYILRSAGLATPINNALFVDDIVDSQRRRLPGRGT